MNSSGSTVQNAMVACTTDRPMNRQTPPAMAASSSSSLAGDQAMGSTAAAQIRTASPCTSRPSAVQRQLAAPAAAAPSSAAAPAADRTRRWTPSTGSCRSRGPAISLSANATSTIPYSSATWGRVQPPMCPKRANSAHSPTNSMTVISSSPSACMITEARYCSCARSETATNRRYRRSPSTMRVSRPARPAAGRCAPAASGRARPARSSSPPGAAAPSRPGPTGMLPV